MVTRGRRRALVTRTVKAGPLRSCLTSVPLASQRSNQYNKPQDPFYRRERSAICANFRHVGTAWQKVRFHGDKLHLLTVGTLAGAFLINNGLMVAAPGPMLGGFSTHFRVAAMPPNVPLNRAQSPLPGPLSPGRADADIGSTTYWRDMWTTFGVPDGAGPPCLIRAAHAQHRRNMLLAPGIYTENFNEFINPQLGRVWSYFFDAQANIKIGEVNLYYGNAMRPALADTIKALGALHLSGIPGFTGQQRRSLIARTIAFFRPYFVHMIQQMNAQHPLFLPNVPAAVVNRWIRHIAPIYNLLVYALHPINPKQRVAVMGNNHPLQANYPTLRSIYDAGRKIDTWSKVISEAKLGNRTVPCLYYLSHLHRSTEEARDAARGAPGSWEPIAWASVSDRHRTPFAHYDYRSLVSLIVNPSMRQVAWPNNPAAERYPAVEARKFQLPKSSTQRGIFERVLVRYQGRATGRDRTDFWKMRCLLYRLFGNFFDSVGKKKSRFRTPHKFRYDGVDVEVGRMSIKTDGHALHICFSLDPGVRFTRQRKAFLTQRRVPTSEEIRKLPTFQDLPPANCGYKTTYAIDKGVVADSLTTAQDESVAIDIGFDQHMYAVKSGHAENLQAHRQNINQLDQQLQQGIMGPAAHQAAVKAAHKRYRIRKSDFIRSVKGRESWKLNYSRAFEQSEEARRRNNYMTAQWNLAANPALLAQTSIDDRIEDMRGQKKRTWGISPFSQRAGMRVALRHRKHLDNFVNERKNAVRRRLTATASRESATMRVARYCAFDIGRMEMERKGFRAKLSKCKKERRNINRVIKRRARRRDAHLVFAGRAAHYSAPAARHKIISIGPGMQNTPRMYGPVKTSALIQYFSRDYSVVVTPERNTSIIDCMSVPQLPTGGRGIQINAANQQIPILPPLPHPPPTNMVRFERETYTCPNHVRLKHERANVHHLPPRVGPAGGPPTRGTHRRRVFCKIGPHGPTLTRHNVLARSTHQQHSGWQRLNRLQGATTPIQRVGQAPQAPFPGLPAHLRNAPAAAQAGPVLPVRSLVHRDLTGATNIMHVSLHYCHYGRRPPWNTVNGARIVTPARKLLWQPPVGWQSHIR